MFAIRSASRNVSPFKPLALALSLVFFSDSLYAQRLTNFYDIRGGCDSGSTRNWNDPYCWDGGLPGAGSYNYMQTSGSTRSGVILNVNVDTYNTLIRGPIDFQHGGYSLATNYLLLGWGDGRSDQGLNYFVNHANSRLNVRNTLTVNQYTTLSQSNGDINVGGGTVNLNNDSVFNQTGGSFIAQDVLMSGATLNTANGGYLRTDNITASNSDIVSRTFAVDSGLSHYTSGNNILTKTATLNNDSSLSTNWLRIGRANSGSMAVNGSSTVDVAATTRIGWEAGGNGLLTINDNAYANLRSTYIGEAAGSYGRLSLADNGRTDASTIRLGSFSGSSGVVSVNDQARLNISDDLYVGGASAGSGGNGSVTTRTDGYIDVADLLQVSNGDSSISSTAGGGIETGRLAVYGGGSVSSQYAWIGGGRNTTDGVFVHSSALIDGGGSSWTNDSFFIIENGGQLTISNGGALRSGLASGYGRLEHAASATIDGRGSSWKQGGQLKISADSQLTISNGGALETEEVLVGNSSLATIDGSGSSWKNERGFTLKRESQLTVSNGGALETGSFDIEEGGQVESEYAYIQAGAASSGGDQITARSASLSGAGTQWSMDYLRLGSSGSGFLDLFYGAKLVARENSIIGYRSSSASYSQMRLFSGASADLGQTWIGYDAGVAGRVGLDDAALTASSLYVGHLGEGVLNAANNSNLSVDDFVVARNAGSTGSVTMTGLSSLTTDNLTVGYSGKGSMHVDNAVVDVSTYGVTLGREQGSNGSSLTVAGNAARLNSDYVYVGLRDHASMDILDGAQVTTDRWAYVGRTETGKGEVTIDGAGSRWQVGERLVVGAGGANAETSTLTVSNGGELSSGDWIKVGEEGNGEVVINGGSVSTASYENFKQTTVDSGGANINASVSNAAGATIDVINGGVANFNGDVINNGSVAVAATSAANFNGGLSGSGVFNGGGTFNLNGSLNPGNSPGLMSFDGDVNFADAFTFTVELAGGVRGLGYDSIDVSNALSLAGQLDVLLINGFTVSQGDYFDLAIADEILGSFDLTVLPLLGDGMRWDLVVLDEFQDGNDYLRLSAVQAVPVPAAAWLFGSALIGLVGIKRKKLNTY